MHYLLGKVSSSVSKGDRTLFLYNQNGEPVKGEISVVMSERAVKSFGTDTFWLWNPLYEKDGKDTSGKNEKIYICSPLLYVGDKYDMENKTFKKFAFALFDIQDKSVCNDTERRKILHRISFYGKCKDKDVREWAICELLSQKEKINTLYQYADQIAPIDWSTAKMVPISDWFSPDVFISGQESKTLIFWDGMTEEETSCCFFPNNIQGSMKASLIPKFISVSTKNKTIKASLRLHEVDNYMLVSGRYWSAYAYAHAEQAFLLDVKPYADSDVRFRATVSKKLEPDLFEQIMQEQGIREEEGYYLPTKEMKWEVVDLLSAVGIHADDEAIFVRFEDGASCAYPIRIICNKYNGACKNAGFEKAEDSFGSPVRVYQK